MYKKNQKRQITLKDFNQPLGLKLNPENKWIKKAAMTPWEAIEKEYADLFPSGCGMPAKPLRMALGALLIQKKYDYSGRELVEQIQENPYYQYFIGLPGFQLEQPFAPSLLVEFRKRLTDEKLAEINEMIIKNNKHDDDNTPPDSNGDIPDIKVITGVRRSGKSKLMDSLVDVIAQEESAKIVCIKLNLKLCLLPESSIE